MPAKAHIAIIHFPIALAITGLLFNLISVFARSEELARATRYVAVVAGLGALAAAAAGLWALSDLGPVGEVAERAFRHRFFGILTTAVLLAQAVWALIARRGMSRAAAFGFLALGLVSAALVSYTGYLGGEIGD